MRKTKYQISILILIMLTACSLPTPEPSNRTTSVEATQTMAALAMQVEATQRAVQEELGDAPSFPQEPADPTMSSQPTQPAAPTGTPRPTSTSSSPIAHVNENTNCRSGPGTFFEIRYIALTGEDIPVVANTTLSDYVVVEDPGHPGQFCWLWMRYVDLRGDLMGLPIRTPPPTPTPSLSFSVMYDYMDGCVGWDPAFLVTNTGSLTFQSYFVEVHDTITATTVDVAVDHFDETSGCPVVTSIPQLDPGMTGWVHAYSFVYDPTGNPLQATLTLCTEPGLGGTCVSRSLHFTP